jgi:hypothetical protein
MAHFFNFWVTRYTASHLNITRWNHFTPTLRARRDLNFTAFVGSRPEVISNDLVPDFLNDKAAADAHRGWISFHHFCVTRSPSWIFAAFRISALTRR